MKPTHLTEPAPLRGAARPSEGTDISVPLLADAVARHRQGHPLDEGDFVGAVDGLADAVAVLVEAADDSQATCMTRVVETFGPVGDVILGLASLANWYATACERNPELFRKPCGQRRAATDEEVRQATAHMAALLRQVAQAMSPTVSALNAATSAACGFYPPDAEFHLDPPAVPTALYLWFDVDDVPIYVGITGDLATRQNRHSVRSSWSEFADRSKVRRYPSRPAAEDAERALIRELRPVFNHVHNDTPEARARLVTYLIEHGRTDLLAPAVSRG